MSKPIQWITLLLTFMLFIGCNDGAGTSTTTTTINGSGSDGTSNWTFTDDGVSFNIFGVSPEAILLDDGSVRLYVTAIGGMKVYKATDTDGLTFTE
jgi:hypothetical protein